MRAVRKVTFSELLTNQAMRKKIIYKLYTKNMSVLKLLLTIVTAGIEALVVPGNKCLYACVNEVCHLHFDNFHQLLINLEEL
jgi:hypothetical protein